ncbi:S9 family peptidase [Edaphobacter dinghuensis]|uniref:Peptidase n=1 Tax=Edaphobacter dinghuensis TaxID=1560005 RepID=A0A917H754_9BACT|nr:S9 family peptidase [Edaphobacter dinghuensis]GGG69665.1 peptidase [Edaphobacter dinghuensis]
MRFGRSLLVVSVLALSASVAVCEVTREAFAHALDRSSEYRKAAGMLPEAPHWIDDSSRFWFEESDGTTHHYVIYDAHTQQRSSLDNAKIAAAISKGLPKPIAADHLALMDLQFDAKEAGFSFVTLRGAWHCTLPDYACTLNQNSGGDSDDDRSKAPGFEGNDEHRAVTSPDGKWEATIQNFNVFLHRVGSEDPATPLSTNGNEGDYYQRSSLAWSPDSKHLLARRVLQGMRRQVHYVESSPSGQIQPIASEHFYAKPGDVLDLEQPVLFNPETRSELNISSDLFPNPYELTDFVWRKDSSAFTFNYNQRGHQKLSVISVDAATGKTREVIVETSRTFIEYTALNPDQFGTGKFYRHDIEDGKEILWLSERDGWAHLYLYNGTTGKVENQITHGDWVVRGVDRVDEQHRQIYFEASGVDPKLDPYFVQGYRINFDGTGMIAMTDAPANHQISYSSDGQFYTDSWSRVDLAPVIVLKRTADRQTIATIAKGDLTKLPTAGWHAPEVFVAKGRDGKTDIWGLIYKPANFDPSKKYPVVEAIYAGPQGSFVPKSFNLRGMPLTELGFVVVQIDGMGTNNRSKAFHDVIWKNLKDGGFEDRILWHKAAAQKFPWYDDTRVGIYGTSAGGQNALGALLFHPEFYKAAVANSGSHDNRMDKMWWNEQWMGWPIGPQYAASSNVDNAYRLQGRLLLVFGEMDHNVDPSSTLQVVNALIKADKDFELLEVPGGGHGAGGEYGERRLLDFFVRSLEGEKTVNWNAAPSTVQHK